MLPPFLLAFHCDREALVILFCLLICLLATRYLSDQLRWKNTILVLGFIWVAVSGNEWSIPTLISWNEEATLWIKPSVVLLTILLVIAPDSPVMEFWSQAERRWYRVLEIGILSAMIGFLAGAMAIRNLGGIDPQMAIRTFLNCVVILCGLRISYQICSESALCRFWERILLLAMVSAGAKAIFLWT